MNDCSFCDEFNDEGTSSFFAFYLKDKCKELGIDSRIVAKTRHFNILPMIGPLVPGYLLIVPKEHYLSFAHLPVELLEEAKLICDELKKVFSIHYTVPVVFEHGPMSVTRKGGCCSDHAHLHVVAVDCDVKDKFSKFMYQPREIKDMLDVKEQVSRDISYLYYKNQKGEHFIMDAPIVESQFVRKLIAVTINAKDRIYWSDSLQISWIINIIQKMKPIFTELKLKGESVWR